MEIYKVIFHINESVKWKPLISNIDNLIVDLGKENTIIEVVANGDAVNDYLNKEIIDTIINKSKLGVLFVACNNSLKSRNVVESQLPKFIKIVNAGVGELVVRQNEGYSYIKP